MSSSFFNVAHNVPRPVHQSEYLSLHREHQETDNVSVLMIHNKKILTSRLSVADLNVHRQVVKGTPDPTSVSN